jgi:hypothetical protein
MQQLWQIGIATCDSTQRYDAINWYPEFVRADTAGEAEIKAGFLGFYRNVRVRKVD